MPSTYNRRAAAEDDIVKGVVTRWNAPVDNRPGKFYLDTNDDTVTVPIWGDRYDIVFSSLPDPDGMVGSTIQVVGVKKTTEYGTECTPKTKGSITIIGDTNDSPPHETPALNGGKSLNEKPATNGQPTTNGQPSRVSTATEREAANRDGQARGNAIAAMTPVVLAYYSQQGVLPTSEASPEDIRAWVARVAKDIGFGATTLVESRADSTNQPEEPLFPNPPSITRV